MPRFARTPRAKGDALAASLIAPGTAGASAQTINVGTHSFERPDTGNNYLFWSGEYGRWNPHWDVSPSDNATLSNQQRSVLTFHNGYTGWTVDASYGDQITASRAVYRAPPQHRRGPHELVSWGKKMVSYNEAAVINVPQHREYFLRP